MAVVVVVVYLLCVHNIPYFVRIPNTRTVYLFVLFSLSVCLSICLSVCLSVCLNLCKERSVKRTKPLSVPATRTVLPNPATDKMKAAIVITKNKARASQSYPTQHSSTPGILFFMGCTRRRWAALIQAGLISKLSKPVQLIKKSHLCQRSCWHKRL